MSEAERELLILIADMMYSLFVAMESDVCVSSNEYTEHTNPMKIALIRLKKSLGVPGYENVEVSDDGVVTSTGQ